MRVLALLAILASFAVQAAVEVVDLDKPGALAALKRDQPEQYVQVLQAMDRIKAVPADPAGGHNAFIDSRTPDPARGEAGAKPATSRLTIPIGEVNYRITVRYLGDRPR